MNKLLPAIWHLPACEDLPTEDPICPDIALRREPCEVQNLSWIWMRFNIFNMLSSSHYLRGTPLDRELCTTITCVLIIYHIPAQREIYPKETNQSKPPCEPEISNFDHIFCSDETISSSKVSMDIVVSLKVGHPAANLAVQCKCLIWWQLTTCTCNAMSRRTQ